MATKLMNELVHSYTEDDSDFGVRAMEAINKLFDGLPDSKSLTDPRRLGSKSTFVSSLRHNIMEQIGPLETDGKSDFNEMTWKDQLRFQANSVLSGDNAWVHKLVIVPANLGPIHLSTKEKHDLMKIRQVADKQKLNDEPQVIDGDRLIAKLCPALVDPNAKWNAVAAALELVTGRRTAEIMKLGEFHLSDDMTQDGYEAMFGGQAKRGLSDAAAYRIPLLAPYSVVKKALERLRSLKDTEGLNTAAINQAFASGLNFYCKRMCNLNPHALRSIYAMMTYELSGKKKSLIGYLQGVLGHATPGPAAAYQRIHIKDLSGPYTPDETVEPEPETDEGGWIFHNRPEKKRVDSIIDMMEHKKLITPYAVRAFGGGSMAVIQRVIASNKPRIDEYNASIA